nr:MAG TPA: hypothetical protein [Caudoviricetes sp.]
MNLFVFRSFYKSNCLTLMVLLTFSTYMPR